MGSRVVPTLISLLVLASACSNSRSNDDDVAPGTAPPTAGATDGEAETSGPVDTTEACAAPTPGVHTFPVARADAEYRVRLYVPTSVDRSPLPVVLNWHGLGSNGGEQALYTGYESVAEQEGFLVVHPTGLPALSFGPASWELAQFDAPDRDDVAFASDLIDELVTRYCADAARVYSIGMSNGGFFTSLLVCELAAKIAAAASVAGTTHHDECAPARPVPYLAFHGTADEVVRYDGGGSIPALGRDTAAATFFDQVMPDEFSQFAADFGCRASTTTELSDRVTRTDYTGCDEATPLSFYTVIGGGHTWPGSAFAVGAERGLGSATTDIDATAITWEFFSRHSLD